jgi:glycosyltransferase involved in cell wall biosynthesis
MKTVSVLVPCFNEEENVESMASALVNLFESDLHNYNYEIVFIDNNSTDNTRNLLRNICSSSKCIKAIFNAKNFGQFNSPYYGLMQTTGDCTILLCCDFQDPIECIPDMVQAWELGNKIVVMQKTTSEESKFMYFFRSLYYKTIKKFSEVEQIEHFTGFGLYDKSFIDVLRNINEPTPFLRGIVAELGYKVAVIQYTQKQRRAGKTHNSFATLYDAAMVSFTSYTKVGLRSATFVGFGVAILSIIIGLIYLVLKMIYWDRFNAGMAPMLVGMFFLGGIQLIFLGLIGEYILSINNRIKQRPLVIEEERIGFDDKND